MLIAHYKLDGDAQDSSGNNHGAVYGATPTTGILNQAYSFNGVDQYIKVPNDPFDQQYTQLTISAWIKISGNGIAENGWQTPVHRGPTTAVGSSMWFIGFNNSSKTIHATIGAGNGVGYTAGNTGINAQLDTWYHVTSTYDGSIVRSYVDGLELKSYELSFVNEAATQRIGASGDGTGYVFNGAVDDVRIYDHALSQRDVKWLASGRLSIRQEEEINRGKILHYTFDKPPKSMENFVPAGERTCDQPFTRQGYHRQAYSYYQENGYTRIYINPTTGDGPYVDWGFYAHKPGGSEVGDVYTISFKYKMIKNVSNTPYLQMAYQNGYKDPTHDHAATLEDEVHTPLKDGWVQYSRTVTITDAGNTWWRFGQGSDNVETEFYVDDFQVELGDSMTPFVDGSRSGLVEDYSGHNNYANLQSSTMPVWTSNSMSGKGAYEFNGVDNSIDIPVTTLSQQKSTLACWIYIQDFATNKDVPGRILCRGNNEYRRMIAFYEGGYAFETDTNSDPYELASRTSGAALSSDITAGSWFHFALVFENNTAYGYINGSLVDTVAIVDDMTIDSFGKNSDIVSYPDRFKGALDDIRIYSQALTQEEVQEIYDLSTKLSIDSNQNSWTKSADQGSTTKLYKTGHLEYDSRFNKNIIEGL